MHKFCACFIDTSSWRCSWSHNNLSFFSVKISVLNNLTETLKNLAENILSLPEIDSQHYSFAFISDIEVEFELTLLTYKVFSCKNVRSKFLGVRLLAVQCNTQSRS